MRRTVVLTATAALSAGLLSGASAGEVSSPQHPAVFETVFASPLGLEGLTTDGRGNLYSPARGADPCPVYRVAATGGPAAVVGKIPAPCNPAGLTFDRRGRLYVANADTVVSFVPDAANPPAATVFTSGVPGANGLAFDRSGALWISDGGTGQGRVWRAGADGVALEQFRVQPLVSDVIPGGLGRDVRGLPPGTVTITPNGRTAADTAGSQHIVANGLAFTADGTLLVADTARGALWRVPMDRTGRPRAATGCDAAFPADTLCLDDVSVQHPYLEGADGIVVDRAGNVWTAANERNAIVLTRRDGRVVEYFRNPADATSKLRNAGPLEFPTSPVLLPDGRLCVTNSDGNRRDNAPNTAGEASPAGAVRAKISCVRP
ncbi:Sugar lactone lactonase YvrE [Amycolatopsis pretoriensis]|uniref:Sugar lactone lactonase YvrE n=1 Tax=Amycolatopsis pretoriensis TaxID=218821 RepID=A0A1H5QVW1_9PSEU|nr:SMP-30/gluconolactonase/LRE family protein [Amycolatopsis pretoriensis]SEF30199.1 Sugar lactone lactonase YvrE [Amycolatopsis pretoriensis]